MWSYLSSDDELIGQFSPKVETHREKTRKSEMDQAAARAQKSRILAAEDDELRLGMEKQLTNGVPLATSSSNDVLLYIKNSGWTVAQLD